MNKINYPIAIIIAAALLGGSYMWVQNQKQQSIEKQVLWQLEQDQQELAAKEARQRIEDLRDGEEEARREEKEEFDNNLKCQNLLDDLKDRWYNVTGISYNKYLNTCMVKYRDTETGEDKESTLESMQDS